MTEKKLIVCDRCGREEEMKMASDMDYRLPEGWKPRMEHRNLGDLCPDCWKTLQKMLEAFISRPELQIREVLRGSKNEIHRMQT